MFVNDSQVDVTEGDRVIICVVPIDETVIRSLILSFSLQFVVTGTTGESIQVLHVIYLTSIQSSEYLVVAQETKTFTMLGEVGIANELTKTTQTSVWMAQHNERTRLHDLTRTPTNLCVH